MIRVNIDYKKILFFIECFVLIPIPYLEHFSSVLVLMKAIRLVIIARELRLIFQRKQLTVAKSYLGFSIALMAYILISLVAVFLKSPDYIVYGINNTVSVLAVLMVLHRKLNEDYSGNAKIIAKYGLIIIVMNTVLLFLLKNGLYTENLHEDMATHDHICYLLGVDNQFGFFIFPMAAIIMFLDGLNGEINKKIKWIVFAAMLATYIYTLSATGLIITICFTVMTVFYKSKLISKIFNIRVLIILYAAIVWLLISAESFLYNGSNAIGYFIQYYLGKNITFSGRTNIWRIALDMIKNSFLIGYGENRGGQFVFYKNTYFTAHNVLLQIMLRSGILGLISFFLTIVASVKGFISSQETCPSLRFIYIGLFTTLLYFAFEQGTLTPFFVMLLIPLEYTICLTRRESLHDVGI